MWQDKDGDVSDASTEVYGRVTAIMVSGTATIESVLNAVANFI